MAEENEVGTSGVKDAVEAGEGAGAAEGEEAAVRGQGYDGASNMAGEFNGLKALVLKDNSSAYSNVHQRQANGIWTYMKAYYDFAYYLHLMKHVLGITNFLSQALQRKDQDIVNAIQMVNAAKQQLQTFRLEGFAPLSSFCEKNEIEIINMEDEYVDPKYKRKKTCITNRYYYEVENFNTVLDMQIQDLGNRFNEVTTELLMCIGCLSPDDSFRAFNAQKILRLAELYPRDFSYEERENLIIELDNYIINLKGDEMFANMNGVSNLAQKMVETNKHLGYPLVNRLLKLTQVLLVATASVERCFSSMKRVKTGLRN
ncbi:uncharacterized protein LOC143623804 [Bidens hawaiensis]|uniref:uncharacterized protein LOC143623804 n=1 Tax=Bidens hawaiensis TaxID=980011 RepID=UPI004049A731